MLRPLAAVLPLVALTPAAADDSPPPDKSGHTLFDPTPDDALRAFAPDRPTKATGPTTVDAGHFQFETDIVSYVWDRRNEEKVASKSFVWFDPTLKLGLTNAIDAEISFVPYLTARATDERTGSVFRGEGLGDAVARLKVNLVGNDSGGIAAALVPWIKLPTAGEGLGNGQVEGGVLAPLTFALGWDFSLEYQLALNALRNGLDDGAHLDVQNTLTLGHPVFDKGTAFIELYQENGPDRGARDIVTADLAFAYLLTDNLQLDTGVNFGLAREAPDVNLYAGFAFRL